jgi:hypothetical protein
MKNRLLLLITACALAIGPAVYAQDAKKDDEPETELGKKMEKISGSWRAVKRQIADATKNEDTLKRQSSSPI